MARLIRLDKVKGYPVSFYNNAGQALEGGMFLELTGLYNSGDITDYEAYGVKLSTATPEGTVVLNTTVPFLYDERHLESDFTLAEGRIGRGHILERGDIITIAKDLVGGSIAVGAKVNYAANGKLVVAEGGTVAQVIAIEKFGDQDSVVLHIL
ncbi:MAG: hypothetical protein ACRDA3_13075 [Peptostreptococcaceae bacterium]